MLIAFYCILIWLLCFIYSKVKSVFVLLQTTQRVSDTPYVLESEKLMPGSFQYAQDSLGFSEEFFKRESPQQSKTNNQERKMKLKGSRKKNDISKKIRKSRVPHQSFVINSAPHKGIRLIKIQVLDLECDQVISDCIHDDRVLLSSQYVVKDVGDEIMDQTEKIISNISKKICNYSYTNWF